MDHRTRPWAVRVIAGSVVSALALALGGCGTSGDAESGTGSSNSIDVVTRWSVSNTAAAAQSRVFKAFTKETGVKVNATDGLETIDDQVENAVAVSKSPDVVIVNLYDKTLGWQDAYVTVPVDDYLREWGLADKMKPSALDEWRVGGKPEGKLQGLPFSGFTWPVWYNTDLLKTVSVDQIPTTTDELIDASRSCAPPTSSRSPSAATTGVGRNSSTRSRSPTPTPRPWRRSCGAAATAPPRP